MCTLAIFRDLSDQFPLVVAANRDEFLARPSRPPSMLTDARGVIAGLDLEASGTWLGCRVEPGVLVAGLLNRRAVDPDAPVRTGSRSRGLLCLDALRSGSVADVVAGLTESSIAEYGPFNLLLADRERAVVVDNGDGIRCTELEAGMSVLTNLDVNDPRCPRLASAVPSFEQVADLLAGDVSLEVLVSSLAEVLSSHFNSLDPADRNPLARVCIHGPEYGTRSSSIIALEQTGRVHYHHADGPPCTTPFQPVRY